jgi:hypothetical protein
MILLQIMLRTLPSYVQPLYGPPRRGHTPTNLTPEEQLEEVSIRGHFFVASAKTMDRGTKISPQTRPSMTPPSTTTVCASTVRGQGILPDSVRFNPSFPEGNLAQPPQLPVPEQNKRFEQVEYLISDFEFIDREQVVKNRLKNHSEFWENILSPSELVLSTVKFGYVIPFLQYPPSENLKNSRSALDNSDFVEEAIKDLLNSNCVIEVSEKPYVVNPLTVSVSDSGKKKL